MRPILSQDINIQLERAHELLKVFDDEVKAFIDSNPQAVVSHCHSKGNREWELILKIRIFRSPPLRLSVLAAEIIQHIRSCLDHLVYQLSVFRAPTLNDLSTVEFPIFSSQHGVSNGIGFSSRDKKGKPIRGSGLYKIRFVQPEAQAVIKSLQPYHDGQHAHLHPLWILQELSNIHKHRRLHLIGCPIGIVSLIPDINSGFELISKEEFARRPLIDGAILAKSLIRELPGLDGKVKVKTIIPIEVAFEEAAIPHWYAGGILENILLWVEINVIPQLSPFLQ